MADLDISIGAKDDASPAFKKVAESAKQLGKDTEAGGKQAAKGTESLAGSLVKAQVAFEALRKAAELAIGFIKGGVADYLEEEKANIRLAAAVRQLGYDANTLAPALSAMADEMENATLVSAEQVQQIQQLLLRYGTAPKDIRAATQALIDYGAASGKDASGSTETLMQALIGGGKEMRAFGISVERTGDRTKDLNAFVAKMSEQFGGSAAAATEGFAGNIGRLEKAQSDLGKAFASFIADVDGKYHVIDSLTQALNGARIALTGDDEQEGLAARNAKYQEQLETIGKVATAIRQMKAELAQTPADAMGFGGLSRRDELQQQIADQEALLSKFKGDLAKERNDLNAGITQGASETAGHIEAGGKTVTAAIERNIHEIRRLEAESNAERARINQGVFSAAAGQLDEALDAMAKEEQDAIDAAIEQLRANRKRIDAEWKLAIGASEGRVGQLSTAVAAKVVDEGAPQMESAGYALGSALVSGLDQAMTQMEGGGEMDVASIVASVLPALITLGIIAAAPEAAPFAPLIGQAVGMMAKHAIAQTNNPKYGGSKYHSGGVVDDRPRFHNGGGLASDEVEAVLQTGEVVWDRGDVARNGGPRAVNAMRSGGGSMNITVQTLDAQSFQEFIGDRGGGGFVRALDQNRGEVAQRFRRLTRRR